MLLLQVALAPHSAGVISFVVFLRVFYATVTVESLTVQHVLLGPTTPATIGTAATLGKYGLSHMKEIE